MTINVKNAKIIILIVQNVGVIEFKIIQIVYVKEILLMIMLHKIVKVNF